MRLSLIGIIGILAFVPPAWADGPGDAAAGYAAIERGEYDEAIALLTRAIGSGELSKYDPAIRGYRDALRINPVSEAARDGLARLGVTP